MNDKGNYLKINEDGEIAVFDELTDSIRESFEAGIIEIIDFESRQYVTEITRGGYRWEFIPRDSIS